MILLPAYCETTLERVSYKTFDVSMFYYMPKEKKREIIKEAIKDGNSALLMILMVMYFDKDA